MPQLYSEFELLVLSDYLVISIMISTVLTGMRFCLYSEPREYEVNKTCVECDPECQLMNDSLTCTGPVSIKPNLQYHMFCQLPVKSVFSFFLIVEIADGSTPVSQTNVFCPTSVLQDTSLNSHHQKTVEKLLVAI